MGWILNWGGQEGGINGLRNMVSTAGIHTQGARKMPWQDLRTAREGGNGFDLGFGACAVAVSLGVGRLWPRNPLTGSEVCMGGPPLPHPEDRPVSIGGSVQKIAARRCAPRSLKLLSYELRFGVAWSYSSEL